MKKLLLILWLLPFFVNAQKDTVWVRDTVKIIIEKSIPNNCCELKTFDRALEILNSSSGIFSNILTALAIILGLIGAVFGFFGIKAYRDLKKTIKESVTEITKTGAEQLKQIQEPVKQIKGDAEFIQGIKNNIEKQLKEVEKMREDIGEQNLSLGKEATSSEDKEKIAELNRRLEMLEVLGVSMNAGDYITRGNEFFGKGEFDLAIKAYNKAIDLNPKNNSAWYNKGIALGKLERYEEAIKAYEKAIDLNPKNANAWNNKGAALGKLERYEEALKASEKAIDLNPKDADVWYNKGVALGKLERYEEALKAYDKAIDFNPKHANAFFNIACIYSLKNDKPNALKNLEQAIGLNIEYKAKAKTDEDFKNLWNDEDFKSMTAFKQ